MRAVFDIDGKITVAASEFVAQLDAISLFAPAWKLAGLPDSFASKPWDPVLWAVPGATATHQGPFGTRTLLD